MGALIVMLETATQTQDLHGIKKCHKLIGGNPLGKMLFKSTLSIEHFSFPNNAVLMYLYADHRALT